VLVFFVLDYPKPNSPSCLSPWRESN